MAGHVAAGDRCFVDEEFEEAVKHYTTALEIAPSSAVYEARSNANIKLERWMDAVQDASKALELDSSNVKAYLRKGTASFFLEEFETALQCFQQGQQLAPDNSQFKTWIKKCKAELEGEVVDTGTAAAPAAAVPEAPPSAVPAATEAAKSAAAPSAEPAVAASAPPAAAAPAAAVPEPSNAIAPAAPEAFTGKYRHQWYQIGNKVVIDVYAKNQPKDAVSVQLSGEDSHLRITIAAQPGAAAAAGGSSSQVAAQQQDQPALQDQEKQQHEGEDYVLELELFSKVHPDQIKVEVLKTKVEVGLVKAQPNLSWPSLEKKAKGPAAAGVAAAAVEQGPPRQYPTSKPTKDWSKVEAEVKELEDKGELDDADPLGAFFKKIFAQGDEDTRRAMMKSFVESNGTVLSTNWKEVGAKKIECTPPEGMELHKWND